MDSLGTLPVRGLEGCLDLIRVARLNEDERNSELSPDLGQLRQFSLVNWVCGIDQHGDRRCLWNHVFQELELLPDKTSGHQCREPGHIPTRMRQTLNETKCDRVGHTDEDQRNRRSSSVDRHGVLRVEGDDYLSRLRRIK